MAKLSKKFIKQMQETLKATRGNRFVFMRYEDFEKIVKAMK